MSNDVTTEKENAELSQDDFANGVYDCLNEEFERRKKNGYGYFVYEDGKLVGVALETPDIFVPPNDKV